MRKRWSRHPMGSLGAEKAQNYFMTKYDIRNKNRIGIIWYFERGSEYLRKELEALSLNEIKKMANNPYTKDNLFVIPFTFLQYRVNVRSRKIRKFLKHCLFSHTDFNEDGNGEETKYCEYFYNNFDDIFDGKVKYSAIDDAPLLPY